MKNRKKLFLIVAIIATISIAANMVSAFNPLGIVWAGSTYPITVTYKWGDRLQTSCVIKDGFERALIDWNSMQMRIQFVNSSSSTNMLNSYTLASSSEYGRFDYSYSPTTFTFTYFNAYVNAGNTNISENNVARSAACHELGHAMSLDEGDVSQSIMYGSRDREIIYRPQQDDLDGVTYEYQ